MKPRVYVETSVISYLTSKPSRDLIVAAHQAMTHDWWTTRRDLYDLYASALVLREAREGDPEASHRRLVAIQGLPLLDLSDSVLELAGAFLSLGAMPREAVEDATHIAAATIHSMDYLLTWNCRHLANAEIQRAIARLCGRRGIEAPSMCTPEELMGVT